jgi:hypothetical protein
MKTVELRLAFTWTCDECGIDNFTRGVTVPPASIHEDEIDESIQEWIESGLSGDFLTIPDTVKCQDCKAEFKAIEVGDE